jgi:dihydroorotate dehydrogenase
VRVHQPLFWLPPETAHHVALRALESLNATPGLRRWVRERLAFSDARLRVDCLGLRFPNPIGVAAGFDKDGRVVPGLEALGFGFVEVGTVTPEPQSGNTGKRLARIPAERALVNRLGFPSAGARVVASRLARAARSIPLGVNLGKNTATPVDHAVDDFLKALRMLYAVGDYLVVNISSPNTPGLRDLHRSTLLDDVLGTLLAEMARQAAARGERPKPLLVKVSPDLTIDDVEGVCNVVVRRGAAGVVVANTLAASPLVARANLGGGGLSGAPIRDATTALVRQFYRRLRGRAEVIGVGGVFTAVDVYEKICAGAALVQTYTGVVYEGPLMPGRICRGLAALLERDGVPSISAAIGSRA